MRPGRSLPGPPPRPEDDPALRAPGQRSIVYPRRHQLDAIYGAAKAATDKMAADMASELTEHNVAVVSLYPGLVRTEAVLAAGVFDLSNSETTEFIGRIVDAIHTSRDPLRNTGEALVAASIAKQLGVTDIDGSQPGALSLADFD